MSQQNQVSLNVRPISEWLSRVTPPISQILAKQVDAELRKLSLISYASLHPIFSGNRISTALGAATTIWLQQQTLNPQFKLMQAMKLNPMFRAMAAFSQIASVQRKLSEATWPIPLPSTKRAATHCETCTEREERRIGFRR